jgi:uncharacterized protein (UPF0212 family)
MQASSCGLGQRTGSRRSSGIASAASIASAGRASVDVRALAVEAAGQPACPDCGEPLGARYGPRQVCWPCLGLPPQRRAMAPEPTWVAFRHRIIDALEGFVYVDADLCAGRCPRCGDVLAVWFVGRLPEADLVCLRGCDERDVAAALGRHRR